MVKEKHKRKPLTEEHKNKLSELLRGRKREFTEEHRSKIVKSIIDGVIANEDKPKWSAYSELFELWKISGMPKHKMFRKIAVNHGYQDSNYQCIVKNFFRDLEEQGFYTTGMTLENCGLLS